MAELTPTDTSITTKVSADLAWARHHLFLLAVVLVLAFAGIYGIESLIAKHDQTADAKWQQILALQNAQTQELKQEIAANELKHAQEETQNLALIGQLATAMEKRDAATVKQTKIDATLSAADAAQRLSQQTGAKPGEVTAQGDNLLVDLPISRGIVTSLDLLPTVQADLADTKNQLKAEISIAANAQSDTADQKKLAGKLQTTIDEDGKACDARVADVKSDARKSKTKIAAIFTVVGVIAARLLGI